MSYIVFFFKFFCAFFYFLAFVVVLTFLPVTASSGFVLKWCNENTVELLPGIISKWIPVERNPELGQTGFMHSGESSVGQLQNADV